ncbi:MAG: type II toxin-antitoxin system VapC family toxin [Acidimicrobiia bacterium]|nr:type II toxin-antitoxin system VapC family toxin [Acidimicrobiia bacterium]MDH5519098.1 type II toxin-antitoxin system VapC family toxin [Acidimicrobiia bacterium]
MSVDGQPGRLLVDSSALLCRYLPDRRQAHVDRLLSSAGELIVTALARTEVELGIHQAVGAPMTEDPDHPASRLLRDWDRFWVLPVDQRCLRRAADLGRQYGLNLVNALHLAAFDALPRPGRLLTVDDRQFAAAADLGFDVVDIDSTGGSAHQLLRAD